MNISFSPQQHISSANFSYHPKDNSVKNSASNNGKLEKHADMNKNNIGKPSGGNLKRNDILKNLMKQKENLVDSKSALMEKALKDGNSPSSIKEELNEIDKQIEEIDKQMSEIQLEDQRKALGAEDNIKNKKNKESSKIPNEASNEDMKTDISKDKMDSILSLSGSLSQAKTLSSQRTSMSGEARVLNSEIKIDEGRGINPIKKKKRVAQLEENIENINEKISDKLKDSNNNNLQNNTSRNTVTKNKQDEHKLIVEQQKAEHNIKHYSDILDDNTEHSGENINATA